MRLGARAAVQPATLDVLTVDISLCATQGTYDRLNSMLSRARRPLWEQAHSLLYLQFLYL